MKKLIIFLLLIISMPVFATDLRQIQYKNLKSGAKIGYNSDLVKWSINPPKKEDYFIKNESGYIAKEGVQNFATECDYEFIKDGKLFGYSNSDLNFYDIVLIDGLMNKRVLTFEEVEKLFPKFKVIKLSQFSQNTNSFKIKKNRETDDIILYNDIDGKFDNYYFTSGNAKFEIYPLKGFISIAKKGMIQFSNDGEKSVQSPWFVLLIR